jgi:hypothetical protein
MLLVPVRGLRRDGVSQVSALTSVNFTGQCFLSSVLLQGTRQERATRVK